MNNEKKFDMTALAVFFPAVIALAIIPVLMQATFVVTDLEKTFQLFGGTEDNGLYYLIDIFSQCKAFAVVLFAVIMLAVALVCCMFLFKRAEKRSLAIVGASVVYVVMALISACLSDYKEIAFYGVHDRAEGFFTTACYFVIFLFTMYAFKKAQNFTPVLIAMFFCVGVNAVLGIFQITGNNLLSQEWFSNLIIDRHYKDAIEMSGLVSNSVYGALYHYNYVGSFMGMAIPLFTTMALFEKKLSIRIPCIIFDLLALFMLGASTARSGVVALAAALVVGIIVFARVIAKHWKVSVSVVAAAAVLAVGANVALDGAIFRRIPSLFSDITELITPAEGDADLFSTLPVREIKQQKDGSVVFVTQTDEMRIAFDEERLDFVITDSEGIEVDYTASNTGIYTFPDERFSGIVLEFFASEDTNDEYNDFFFLRFYDAESSPLIFYLNGKGIIKQVDNNTGDAIATVNAEAIGFKGKEKIGSSRGYIWSRTIPLLKNCFAVGYGADTFVYEFPQTDYLAKYYAYGSFDMTVDKVHNLYLQTMISNGLIALIAMLFIFVWYLVDCFRLYALKKEYRTEQIYGAAVMLAVVGYLAAGMFNDSVVSVAPVFWILLGVGFALNTINRRMDRGEDVDAEPEVDLTRKLSKQEQKMVQDAELAGAVLAARMRTQQENNAPKTPDNVTKADVQNLLDRVNGITAKSAESKEDDKSDAEE